MYNLGPVEEWHLLSEGGDELQYLMVSISRVREIRKIRKDLG